jgi:hypothetical protein
MLELCEAEGLAGVFRHDKCSFEYVFVSHFPSFLRSTVNYKYL